MPWPCYFFGLIFLIFDAGIGAGLESMTVDRVNRLPNINPKVWWSCIFWCPHFPLRHIRLDFSLYSQVETFAEARDCLLPMGITSENVAQRYGVTRLEQDQAAVSMTKVFSVLSMYEKIIRKHELLICMIRLSLTSELQLQQQLASSKKKSFQFLQR